MRQVVGWLILLIGFFILGMILNQFLSQKTQPLSPIPNNDEIRVIMLTPVDTSR